MVKVVKCENYEKLLNVAKAWDKVERVEEWSSEDLAFWFPLFAYLEDGEMYVTDTAPSAKCVVVSLDDYDNIVEVMNIYRYFKGFDGMDSSFIEYIGRNLKIIYKNKDNQLVSDTGIKFPEQSLVPSQVGFNVERGNIVELQSPFISSEELKKYFKVSKEELVVISFNSGDCVAKVQVRGTKNTLSVHSSLLYVTGSIVRFKRPSVATGDVHNFEEEYDLVKEFYRSRGITLSSDFKSTVKCSLNEKNDYIGFLFGGGTTIRIGESTQDRHVIIKHHHKFKEMLEHLEELGINTSERMDEILENSLMIDGKVKRVTGLLQAQKKVRYDDVYAYPETLFPDNITISISPFEFATASYNVESGSRSGDLSSSCYSPDGSYHAAVWAYFQSKQTAIIKMKNKNGETYYRTWLSFDLDNGGIIMGRQYGSISETQVRNLRYILEKRVSDFLGVPNSWRVTSDINIDWDYSSDNTYLDSPKYVMVNKAISPTNLSVELPSAICADGDESSDGEFCNSNYYSCDCCGDNYDRDELTELSNGDIVCDHCLSEYYVMCERRSTYIPRDDAIFIQDEEYWVDDRYADDYYLIDDTYYLNIPDDYRELSDGSLVLVDDTFMCEIDEEWYHVDDKVMVFIKGVQKAVYSGNVPSTHKECCGCGTFIHKNSKTCPECGEKLSSSKELENVA